MFQKGERIVPTLRRVVPADDRCILFSPASLEGSFSSKYRNYVPSYRLNTHVKPLLWIESAIDLGQSKSRIEYMIRARSQFKSRSVANNVEIIVPVPSDVDSPSFKTSIGSVRYSPDQDAIVWSRGFLGRKLFQSTHSHSPMAVSCNKFCNQK